jgi:type II secretory pathway pseudopilin PulG
VAIIGIIAAIAIPSLLRARVSANEAATIGDIRTVISAQAAFQSANGGWYGGSLSCLNNPNVGQPCIPNYPPGAPTFLDTAVAGMAPKSGYSRSWGAGSTPSPISTNTTGTNSVSSYVYLASPVSNGQTGVRGFGGDASGVLCFNSTGVAPSVTGTIALNTTAADCNVLQ